MSFSGLQGHHLILAERSSTTTIKWAVMRNVPRPRWAARALAPGTTSTATAPRRRELGRAAATSQPSPKSRRKSLTKAIAVPARPPSCFLGTAGLSAPCREEATPGLPSSGHRSCSRGPDEAPAAHCPRHKGGAWGLSSPFCGGVVLVGGAAAGACGEQAGTVPPRPLYDVCGAGVLPYRFCCLCPFPVVQLSWVCVRAAPCKQAEGRFFPPLC